MSTRFLLLPLLLLLLECEVDSFLLPQHVNKKVKSRCLNSIDKTILPNQKQKDELILIPPIVNTGDVVDRRTLLTQATQASISTLVALGTATPSPASAATTTIGKDSEWKLWPALPVAPYARRKTIFREVIPGEIWIFDQLIGIYYVQLPIRMTVIKLQNSSGGGLFVYAPIAPTKECLALLQPLIDKYGPVKYIVLPSVAVEHKVNAGPFARCFPNADFYVVDKQYSFPVPLPSQFLGFPSWTKILPESSDDMIVPWGGEFDHEVLTVFPGPASAYQDAAFFHRPSKTLLVCDAVFAVDDTPPPILTDVPEYVRALLFHARESRNEIVEDSPEARRKGWKRIVLLFNFFFPGAADVDLGITPLLKLNFGYKYGWGGWYPVEWRGTESKAFEVFSSKGKPTVLPIIQIILSRGGDGDAAKQWVDKITAKWNFERVIPQHLNAPLNIGPKEFAEPFRFAYDKTNKVRFCDEDVTFLRNAEEGFLHFSVYKSKIGVLRGREDCNL